MNKTEENNDLIKDSAKHELNLLAKLIGREETERPELEFWLCLGNEENQNQDSNQKQNYQLNELELSEGIHTNKSLETIIHDLNFDDIGESGDTSNGNDLLSLMDS